MAVDTYLEEPGSIGMPVGYTSPGQSASGDTVASVPSPSAPYSPTLAAEFANYYQGIASGSLGALAPVESEAFMNGSPSLQPVAPQEPGNVLTGRFGNLARNKALWVLGIAAVVVLAWWLWKRAK